MRMIYAGRKAEKEYIKPGGENVYIAEVEKVILEYPSVKKVVFGVPDPKWKEGIKQEFIGKALFWQAKYHNSSKLPSDFL